MSYEMREIEGFPGYFVSNTGEVFGPKYGIKSTLKPCEDHDGYLMLTLVINKKRFTKKLHRIVAASFICNPDNKPQINHKDGNKKNNNVENLEWVTAKENSAHAIESGIKNEQGSNHGMSKLTEKDVIEMRNIWNNTSKKRGILIKLSEMFGVTKSNVCMIVNRKAWVHI